MPSNTQRALVVNAGSSSLRLASFFLEENIQCLDEQHLTPRPPSSARVLTDFAHRRAASGPDLVVHRVVHGGEKHPGPCMIDDSVERDIENLNELAPLHNGIALDWIRTAREAFGSGVQQVACFDTAFFTKLPDEAARYAVPRDLYQKHQIRRYGFHGLAHQSLLDQLYARSGTQAPRVISLQLGAGCSVTATDRGQPVDTSMGFSPLSGLIMATRSGDLDPAIVLQLVARGGISPADLGRMLNESSGLLGVSGLSGDMQELLASDAEDSKLAIAMFCHRARQYIGAYLAVLGGVDVIVFGGGIGEHAPDIRARILDRLSWAGIRVDIARNQTMDGACGGPIHAEEESVEIWVLPTDEEVLMAASARRLLASRDQPCDKKTEASA